MKYNLCDKVLEWDIDKTENDVSKIPENNLFIKDIWNMRDTVGRDEICVAVDILSEDTFSFNIFAGIRFVMKIDNDTVVCIEKTITK